MYDMQEIKMQMNISVSSQEELSKKCESPVTGKNVPKKRWKSSENTQLKQK
jgi:hypothetical protein